MKESFDDILKRKWEKQHFPVDEGHRKEMAELLKIKTRRRIFPFWWLGGLVLLSGILGYFLFAGKAMTPEEHLPPNSDSTGTITVLNNPSTTNDLITNADDELSSAASSVPRHESLSGENSGLPIESNKTIYSKNRISKLKSEKPATTMQSDVLSTNVINVSKSNDHNVNNTPSSLALQEKQDLQQPDKVILPVDEKSVVIAQPDVNEIGSNSLTYERASAVYPTMETLDLQGIIYAYGNSVDKVEIRSSTRRSLYLFGEAGAGMILASRPDFTSGWKVKAGGGLGYRLNPHMHLAWTSGYMMQNGGFDFERTSTVTQLGFGIRSSFNRLAPDRLHFVYSKLGARYRMKRHIIAAHGGFQWLYGAQGDIVVHTMDQFATGLLETSRYAWLKADGLRRLHWTGDLAYGYQLSPRMSVMAGSDIYFSSFVIEDDALSAEGYYWNGRLARWHPFITLNYMIYESR